MQRRCCNNGYQTEAEAEESEIEMQNVPDASNCFDRMILAAAYVKNQNFDVRGTEKRYVV